MRNKKSIYIICLSVIILLSISIQAFARVRIVVRPWWPRRAIVIAPPPLYIPPPRRNPPAQKPPVGYVDLNVRPNDANVYADGGYMGAVYDFSCAPQCLNLAPGMHSITLSKQGFKTTHFTVRVIRHEIIEVDATLALEREKIIKPEPTYKLALDKTGFLVFQVTPPDASVYIDGHFYGITSQFSESQASLVIRSGKHKVEIVKPGYQTYMTNVEISDGKVKKIHIKLLKSGS